MSVVFEQAVHKMQSVAAGLKKNYAEAERFGVTSEKISTLEADGQKALELIAEVEAIREQASKKLAEANAMLDKAKTEYNELRYAIRNNVPQDKWIRFGLLDKR